MQQRRRRLARRLALGAGTLVVGAIVATLGFAAITALRVSDNIAQNAVARPGAEDTGPAVPDWDGPVNVLIMGSDARDGQSSGNYGDESGARSDVMMLLHVSSDHSNATLVSIPRDTMLPLPECTTASGETVPRQDAAMINSALNVGPYCSLDAIREFSGLDVDHFIVVDFDGVIGVTDAIGGVDVCVAVDVDDPHSGLSLAAGTHTIQGAQALAFLRTRYGFGDGSDLGRIHTQQTYLAALARKVKSADTLTNPIAMFSLADAASKSITVDSGLSDPAQLVGLAGTLAGIDLDHIALVQLPVQDYWADRNRVEPIADQARELFAALADDRPIVFDAPAEQAETGASAPSDASGAGSTTPPAALAPGAKGQSAATATCAG